MFITVVIYGFKTSFDALIQHEFNLTKMCIYPLLLQLYVMHLMWPDGPLMSVVISINGRFCSFLCLSVHCFQPVAHVHYSDS